MADLAQRLDVTGRRIVVLAGPGDRRDEDLCAIADAVAGRFDHYVCRRDDSLRDRAPDEVPRIQAEALAARGVAKSQISIIPDEQEAIDAALRMGRAGDLLLIFADALTRSWKQIIRFKPASEGAPPLAAEVAGPEAAARGVSTPGSGIGGFIAGTATSPVSHGETVRSASEAYAAPAARAAYTNVGRHREAPAANGQVDVAERIGTTMFAGESSRELTGLIRDERGVRLAPENDD
jgi:hypothetical protein